VEERPLFYLGLPGIFSFFIGIFFAFWALQLYAVEQRIVTNVFLTSMIFTLIGIFTIFTAVTLYAVVRLTQKLKPNDKKQ
jgi:hypothetical protein